MKKRTLDPKARENYTRRSFRTTNEKRQYDRVFGRSKRNPTNLPDNWSDTYPSRFGDKSWKVIGKRKKQWDKNPT